METNEQGLEKAWPKEYDRVKGQTKHKGVASKDQMQLMRAAAGGKVADISVADAKAYLANSPKGGEGLPDKGTGGKRGEREQDSKKKKEAKHKKKDKTEKTDSIKPEFSAKSEDEESIKRIKEKYKEQKPKTINDQAESIRQIKEKYKEKKPKTLGEQVENIKQRYKVVTKSRDLFYAKVEGCLNKGVSEELISQFLDMDAYLFKDDDISRDQLYISADRYFDATLSPEEQVVYELSYMAKSGCDISLNSLVSFLDEMHNELLKSISVDDVIRDSIKISLEKREARRGHVDLIEGGLADSKKPCDFNQEQLEAGIKVEMEHTNDRKIAQEITMDHLTEDPDYYKKLKTMEKDIKTASEDDSRVKGKQNGESYRMVNGYKRYTSGAKRGEYVHRHEAEKRLGRKLGSKDHVHHKDGNRAGTKNTEVSSAGDHSAETNKKRAKSKNGYSGDHRYAHHGGH